MKAERRHDLKSSDLEDHLMGLAETLRRNGTRILAVVLVALIVGVGGFMLYNNKVNASYDAWEQLFALSQTDQANPEAAARIAQQSSDLVVTGWAWKLYGDALAQQAMAGAPEKLAAGLNEALRAYQQAEQTLPDSAVLMASARMGEACVLEGLGKWDEAKNLYEMVSKNLGLTGTGISEVASVRLASLDQRRSAAATFVLASPTTKSASAENEKVAN
jgi:tetratricopeptide (TPR) repeat protein